MDPTKKPLTLKPEKEEFEIVEFDFAFIRPGKLARILFGDWATKRGKVKIFKEITHGDLTGELTGDPFAYTRIEIIPHGTYRWLQPLSRASLIAQVAVNYVSLLLKEAGHDEVCAVGGHIINHGTYIYSRLHTK